jgi:hypothetical protein
MGRQRSLYFGPAAHFEIIKQLIALPKTTQVNKYKKACQLKTPTGFYSDRQKNNF